MNPERFRRIQSLFSEAVELDTDQREAWLQEQCGDDSELLDAVHQLLSYDRSHTLVVNAAAAYDTTVRNRSTVRNTPRSFVDALPPRTLFIIGALAALIPLMICGAIIRSILDGYREEMRATSLVNLVNAKSAAITAWLSREQQIAQTWADNPEIRQLIVDLNQRVTSESASDPSVRETMREKEQQLGAELNALAGGPIRFAAWNRSLVTIADWSGDPDVMGASVTPDGAKRLTEVFQHGSLVAVIGSQDRITANYSQMPSKPIIAVFARVSDKQGTPIAVLMIANPQIEEELSDFIHITRGDGVSIAEDAGVFVFNQTGTLLLDSPYDEQLKMLGLLDKQREVYSAKNLVLRDPGFKLTPGTRLPEPRSAWPLTKMARMAIAGQSGYDVDGYRDVRGVLVAGAWKWLDKFQFGIGVEIERNTIHPSWWVAKVESLVIIGLIGLSLGLATFAWLTVRRLKREMQQAQRIGPYLLEQEIGRGGMGCVFKARHDLLKRPTAIKLLHREHTDETSIARFKREAQLAARLEHPNTVLVYDFGVNQSQQFYLVMEWIDGETLDRRIRRVGKLPIGLTAHILRQIASSLQEAHGLGLIHRDLKPQNVMITKRAGEADFVKVLDFGLARELSPGATTGTALTLTSEGVVAGTPRYMSPERWNASSELTTAVDWFAFGCLGFYMLTGREAIAGETIAEIARQVSQSLPVKPSQHSSDVIPAWLDELIVRCTLPNPGERIQAADEVLSILASQSD